MPADREQEFWDLEAAGLTLAQLEREAAFVAAEPQWGWAMSEIARRGPGRTLDLGCGRGATTRLLARGADEVVGVDLSCGALAAARRLARSEARPPHFVAARLERLPFRDHSFDLVAGRFVLHHAERLDHAAAEIARVLRPGGCGVFVETWGRNPLLAFGRELGALLGTGLGTADERPLGPREIELLEARFRVRVEFPVFVALSLSDRVWKRLRPLYLRSGRARRWIGLAWQRAIDADAWIDRRLPALRPWGWHAGLVLERR